MTAALKSPPTPPLGPSQSYLAPNLSLPQLRSMFEAANALSESQPFYGVPWEDTPILIQSEDLNLNDAVLVCFEPQEFDCGLALFKDRETWQRFLSHLREKPNHAPVDHLELRFDGDEYRPPSLLHEIHTHGWVYDDPFGVPTWQRNHPTLGPSWLSADELHQLEAIARALTVAFEGPRNQRWLQAWQGQREYALTLRVSCFRGPVQLTLQPQPVHEHHRVLDQMQALLTPGPFNNERFRQLCADLLYAFSFSEPGYSLRMYNDHLESLMHLAHLHRHESLATLSPPDLKTLLVDHLPGLCSPDDEYEAPGILHSVRALYQYLHLRYKLPQAPACMRLLSQKTTQNAFRRALRHQSVLH